MVSATHTDLNAKARALAIAKLGVTIGGGGKYGTTSTVTSVRDHLAESRCVVLGQVPFIKIRNLVHFADLTVLF